MSPGYAFIGFSHPTFSTLATGNIGVQVTFHSHLFSPGSWTKLPQIWQVYVLMIGGREPGAPERALGSRRSGFGVVAGRQLAE